MKPESAFRGLGGVLVSGGPGMMLKGWLQAAIRSGAGMKVGLCMFFWLVVMAGAAWPAGAAENWEHFFGGARRDTSFAIDAFADGGIIAAGYTRSKGPGDADILLLRLDRRGHLLWQKVIGGTTVQHQWLTDDVQLGIGANAGKLCGTVSARIGAKGFVIVPVNTVRAHARHLYLYIGEHDYTCGQRTPRLRRPLGVQMV